MTAAEPPTRTSVTTMRRPPVCQSTMVRSDLDHTFGTFVRTIGEWWPVASFSMGHDRIRAVTFEEAVGGRVYETWDDGNTVDWGQVLLWDPPNQFTMTWLTTPAATEVEFTFAALGPDLTRVSVDHRGW